MPPTKPRGHPWRENLETLTGAIVLALLFKAFLVEISRIPSPSMQPTLMGSDGIFDRILVDKLSYRFRAPERWEIAVFRHPLQRSRNMVKRVVGMPGEEIRIENGDLWVRRDAKSSWEIPRRPRAVQQEMWKAIDRKDPRLSSWRVRGETSDWELAGRDITARGSGRARFRPDDETVLNEYKHGYPDVIRPDSSWPVPAGAEGKDERAVGDLRITCEVRVESDCEEISAHVAEGPYVYRFVVPGPAAGEEAVPVIEVWMETELLSKGGEPIARAVADPLHLDGGDSFDLGAQNLDDRLTLEIDGEWVAELDIDPVADASSFVELVQEGAGARFADIQVHRDVHYLEQATLGRPTLIPEDHFYMMGDNTQGSADSREWTAATYEVPLEGGGTRVVRGNFYGLQNPSEGYDRSGKPTAFFRDEWGERHLLPADLPATHNASSTVPRTLIRGRALAVFWPLKPWNGVWRLAWLH